MNILREIAAAERKLNGPVYKPFDRSVANSAYVFYEQRDGVDGAIAALKQMKDTREQVAALRKDDPAALVKAMQEGRLRSIGVNVS